MIARDQTFSDMRIVLDGCSFYDCTFRSCVFIYCASLPVVLQGSHFEGNCRWEFDRAAKWTVEFLEMMYRAGATRLVENTFDAIRGVRPKGTHLI
jgi:hypothetical protein